MNASAKYYSGGGLGGALIQWDAKLAAASYRPPGWDLFYFFPARKSRRFSYSYTQNEPEVSTHKAGTLSVPRRRESYLASLLSCEWPEPARRRCHRNRSRSHDDSRELAVHTRSPECLLRRDSRETRDERHARTRRHGHRRKRRARRPSHGRIEGVLGSSAIAKMPRSSTSKPATSRARQRRLSARSATQRQYRLFCVSYRLRSKGSPNVTQYAIPWYAATEKKTDFAVIPDKAMYRVGDKAKLEIQSTVLPATAVVTFARQGMIAQKRLELTTPSSIIELRSSRDTSKTYTWWLIAGVSGDTSTG